MVELHRSGASGVHTLHRLERHATELFVIVYEHSSATKIGKASTAIERKKPTINELEAAAAKILELSKQNRYAASGGIAGIYTYESDGAYEKEIPYFFDTNGDKASGDVLEQFLLARL